MISILFEDSARVSWCINDLVTIFYMVVTIQPLRETTHDGLALETIDNQGFTNNLRVYHILLMISIPQH